MKKNSVLDEEAYIYNRRTEESESDKWKKMSRQEKFAYFNDYYRNKVIIGIIVLGFVVSFLYTVLAPRPDVVVSIAVVNDYWSDVKTDEVRKEMTELLGLYEGKQEIQIDDSYYLKESGMGNEIANTQRLVAKITAEDINVIVADKEKFEEFAKSGTFMKVSEVIHDTGSYGDRLTSDGYGISLKGSRLLKEFDSTQEEMILGIVANADEEDYEYISKIVNYILQKS